MRKTYVLRMVLVATVVLLLGGAEKSVGQGPPPFPEIGMLLESYHFNDTNWISTRGHTPKSWSGVETVPTWNTNAARFAGTNAAWLNYHWIEPSDGRTNFSGARGALWFWYRPIFSGTNHGGAGPGYSARLFEVGSFGDTNGWWSIHLNPAGDRIFFSGANTNGSAVYADSAIDCVSNEWVMVAINFTHTNSTIFLSGTAVTNSIGVLYPPSATVLSNGFFIGSDEFGQNKAEGDIELLGIFGGHPVTELMIQGVYSNMLARIQQWEGGGGEGLMSGDAGGSFELLDGGSGGESFGPTEGLVLTSAAVEGTNFVATITGGSEGLWYDFFRGTNFIGNSGTNSQWTWLGQGTNFGRYALPELSRPHAFYVLGTPQDSDADGLSDAYEALVQKTGQQNPDTDRDGLSDWYELNVSHTDPFTPQSVPSFLNRSITRCPVTF